MKDADFKGGGSNDPLSLPAVGDHLVQVSNIRMLSGFHGRKFFIDYTVVDGPSPKGYRASFMVDLDNFYVGGKMTKQMAYAKELGKVGKAVAAVLGYEAKDAAVVSDEIFEQAVAQRPKSVLAGRLITVRSVPYKNKKGQDTSFCEVYPLSEWGGKLPEGYVDPTKADATPAAEAKAAPKAPPVSKKAPAFPPAGWEVHPDDPEYYFNSDTEEVITEAELRARG